MNHELKVGYNRQITTPEKGTWLSGYGNDRDRPTIGKIFEDDDLTITAIAMTDSHDQTIIVLTVDLCGISLTFCNDLFKGIEDETGVKTENILISATHSHSSPGFWADETPEALKPWYAILLSKGIEAAKEALADRKPAEAFVGIRRLEGLNFVRRYMLDGKFLGTNHAGGDAHESKADNRFQMIKFVRDGGDDVVLVNWAGHPDHSKSIGGEPGTPGFHKGCSADYIYGFRTEFEKLSGAKVAFFQAAGGNVNTRSAIPGEAVRAEKRAEKEGIMRYIAYGKELADEALILYRSELQKVECHDANGMKDKVMADRRSGVPVGSPRYNAAYATSVITFASATLEEPTKESLDAAQMLIEKFELGDIENVRKIAEDKDHPLYTHANCVKVLTDGGKMSATNAYTRECAIAMSKYFEFTSGPYATNKIVMHAKNQSLPPITLPLSAVSIGDIAFVGAPVEAFDTTGSEVKDASPFKMTFFTELSGASRGYLPSKLAWSHGGYEVESTSMAEGTAEKMSGKFIEMLNALKTEEK